VVGQALSPIKRNARGEKSSVGHFMGVQDDGWKLAKETETERTAGGLLIKTERQDLDGKFLGNS